MWHEFDDPAPREEGAAEAWIAAELRRRSALRAKHRPAWWRRLMPLPAYRLSGALAAVLLLACVAALYTLRSRTGSPDLSGSGSVLRSQAVALVAPLGDLDARPAELRWQPVPGTVTYMVEVLEVDHHSLWKSNTSGTSLPVPAAVRALMVPGKTLLWQVNAVGSSGATLAASGLQKFKVKVNKSTGEEL
jgi:hypothetical protein